MLTFTTYLPHCIFDILLTLQIKKFLHCCKLNVVPIYMLNGHVSYPVNLWVLQQQLHYLCVTSSGCKVQRGAELAVQQVWITVTFLQ